jgi:hypothetical protein
MPAVSYVLVRSVRVLLSPHHDRGAGAVHEPRRLSDVEGSERSSSNESNCSRLVSIRTRRQLPTQRTDRRTGDADRSSSVNSSARVDASGSTSGVVNSLVTERENFIVGDMICRRERGRERGRKSGERCCRAHMAFYQWLYFRGGTHTSAWWGPRGEKLGPSGWRCTSVLSRELHHAAPQSRDHHRRELSSGASRAQ